MANNVLVNPMVVDAPSGTILTTKRVQVLNIRWVAPAASAGHQALITDRAGRVKWASVASGPNFSDNCEPGRGREGVYWDGVRVPTLASGTLYITVS